MKRLSLLITMLVLAISQLSAQDNSNQGTITLSHNGKESFFAYNKMGDAVEAAADGDTIYLSKGEFEGDFRLNKKLRLSEAEPMAATAPAAIPVITVETSL